jgi:hypothetical protein
MQEHNLCAAKFCNGLEQYGPYLSPVPLPHQIRVETRWMAPDDKSVSPLVKMASYIVENRIHYSILKEPCYEHSVFPGGPPTIHRYTNYVDVGFNDAADAGFFKLKFGV